LVLNVYGYFYSTVVLVFWCIFILLGEDEILLGGIFKLLEGIALLFGGIVRLF